MIFCIDNQTTYFEHIPEEKTHDVQTWEDKVKMHIWKFLRISKRLIVSWDKKTSTTILHRKTNDVAKAYSNLFISSNLSARQIDNKRPLICLPLVTVLCNCNVMTESGESDQLNFFLRANTIIYPKYIISPWTIWHLILNKTQCNASVTQRNVNNIFSFPVF